MQHPVRSRIEAASKLFVLVMLAATLGITWLALASDPAHAAGPFTVNSTGDKGDLNPGDGKCFTGDILVVQGEECTLRAAIQESNTTATPDAIGFDIPTTGVATISPDTTLPTIDKPVAIDGYSQTGAKPNTLATGNDAVLKIQLSGADTIGNGLRVTAASSSIEGLVVNDWDVGIRITDSGASGNKITGNFIGTDASGTTDVGNGISGVHVGASDNTIGGATPKDRNVISGNGDGVFVSGGATGIKVVGNYIGIDRSGTAPLPNSFGGVRVESGSNNTIGGATAGNRNVISGNAGSGVSFNGSNTSGNRVFGNFIGTDVSGTKDLGNGADGVNVYAPGNTVGGTTPAERNVISGNENNGVTFYGPFSTGNRILGNRIGTDASGTRDLGNAANGVGVLQAGAANIVGGTTAAERNVISGNGKSGIRFLNIGAEGNTVEGNYVGTDASGTKKLGNAENGVLIENSSTVEVGGTTAGERNVVSGNGSGGITVDGAGSKGNGISGNFVGTDATGSRDLGNYYGVHINGSAGNTVGGATVGTRNVISGNDSQGIVIFGNGSTGNRVAGNYVGTDVSGTKRLGNAEAGVFVSAPGNVIGGTMAGERNVVSANGEGVGIFGSTGGNKVVGNFIGTDRGGTAPLGNARFGVHIDRAPDNFVGGMTAGSRNVISANGLDGVAVVGEDATGNRILSNSIFVNGGLGIDLLGGTENAAGVTTNDPKDPDAGPNKLQNKPALTSAVSAATSTTVRGTLDSTPNTTFRIQLFHNAPGGDEGRTLLGEKVVTTGPLGNVSFGFVAGSALPGGRTITATATDPNGNTSEFSAPRTVVAQ